MPQLKKISLPPNNILPKLNHTIGFGNANESLYSSAYLTLLMEDDKSQSYTSEPESDVSDSVQNRPRKRQRLDHLSQEEKVMRRKLKNRVAAQTARDRKKAKMQELEEQVSRLVVEKRVLFVKSIESVKKIRALEQENAELKLRLGLTDIESNSQKVKMESNSNTDSFSVEDENRSLEHALLINGTLLKEQDLRILSFWMMQFVYLPAIARLMTFWVCCSSVGKILWERSSLTPMLTPVKHNNKTLSSQKWWGPHQRAWNPTKN